MLLSILIPTYNRCNDLLKNINQLTNYIKELREIENISIIISNNCSTDKTSELVNEFINKNNNVHIKLYNQTENLGLEKNALFVLDKANSDYIMYLGDDDYISPDYLKEVMNNLRMKSNLGLIVPSYNAVDESGNYISGSRDVGNKSRYIKNGFVNCRTNAWRGHQLSGLVLKRQNLYQNYIDHQVNNIYPFIFMVGINCLSYDSYQLFDYPVKVTQVSQSKKDWGYGNDGLFNEIFDNYIKLPISSFQSTELQVVHYIRQPWRLWKYNSISKRLFISVLMNVWFSKNSTFYFKIIFPLVVLYNKLVRK